MFFIYSPSCLHVSMIWNHQYPSTTRKMLDNIPAYKAAVCIIYTPSQTHRIQRHSRVWWFRHCKTSNVGRLESGFCGSWSGAVNSLKEFDWNPLRNPDVHVKFQMISSAWIFLGTQLWNWILTGWDYLVLDDMVVNLCRDVGFTFQGCRAAISDLALACWHCWLSRPSFLPELFWWQWNVYMCISYIHIQ